MILGPTTSLQRTYRYLRIAIALTVVVILVAAAVEIPQFGVLRSLSHYAYTPAHTMFAGALVAASALLFALSGRGVQRVLLDAAALFVPLIAIVPTVIAPGEVPGVAVACASGCVPSAWAADADNGVITYLVVGAMIAVLAGVLIAFGQVDRAGGMLSLTLAVIVLAVVGLTWGLWRAEFLQWAHYVAAAVFFALVAAVAFAEAFWPAGRRPVAGWVRGSYIVISIALVIDVLVLAVFGATRSGGTYGVLVGEVIALLLFLAFWVVQSIQNWNDPDPASLR
ncbi:hypothetical protein [Microbacterium rhizomatis]|uniref:DUF998 domain-containing protein n=1 Tax=Microbacterium rhizomatis TaxID=1631477 RepID=A0A5J5J1B2_9MICO|nr:hypothetical protein [Microbacterium rhizomatis]KAA9107774.1 hypothetical protein F6B43_10065 [Microbacterium rhizomatis]